MDGFTASATGYIIRIALNIFKMMQKEIMIEGLLSIQAGENPRVIEEKLKSFVSPGERANSGEDGGEEDG